MAKKKTKSKRDAPTFEASIDELEQVVANLESGELGLDDALEQYERGVKRLKACYKLLENAERRIALVSGVDAEGNPVTEPFDDDDAESLDEKAAARGKRRTRQAADSRRPTRVDDSGSLF